MLRAHHGLFQVMSSYPAGMRLVGHQLDLQIAGDPAARGGGCCFMVDGSEWVGKKKCPPESSEL